MNPNHKPTPPRGATPTPIPPATAGERKARFCLDCRGVLVIAPQVICYACHEMWQREVTEAHTLNRTDVYL